MRFLLNKTLGATFLIVGTSIGAGMLGLPVETGQAGFFPSVLIMVLVWVATTASALLLADVVIAGKRGANFFSLTEHYFGSFARGVTLLFYFLLFFSLITAYSKGGGGFVADLFQMHSVSAGSLLFVLFFLPFIFLGTYLAEKLNRLITILLFLFYFALVAVGMRYVDAANLVTHAFGRVLFSTPLIITAFSYHGVLPTIVEYLERDIGKIKRAILSGAGITFFIYFVWQYLLIGTIPLSGELSLQAARAADKTAMLYLQRITGSGHVSMLALGFSFAALTTSFLGVSLGVIDFFCDVFRLKQSLKNRVVISISILLPALLVSMLPLPIFYFSLKYGAGISCIYLLIFLPTAMWARQPNRGRVLGVAKKSAVPFLYGFSALAFLITLVSILYQS